MDKYDFDNERVEILEEVRQKHAQLSKDRISDWGSNEHIKDLETRISDATYWRNKYPRGSEKRGHYKNVLSHLKRELHSARKKNQLNEKQKQVEAKVKNLLKGYIEEILSEELSNQK